MNLLETISRLQKEREDRNIVPSHILVSDLKNEISNEMYKELNELFRQGKIIVKDTVKGKAVKIE